MTNIVSSTCLERSFRSKANREQVTERLYSIVGCRLSLGAVRGGPLTLADAKTWEIFTLDGGIRYGDSVGWVTDEGLTRAVDRLERFAAGAWTPQREDVSV